MMGFRATPSFNTLSPGQLVRDAYEQPMSLGSTFLDQLGGGALESYGLGTFLRGSSLPMTAPLEKQSVYTGRTVGGLQEQRWETDEEFAARRKAAGAMTQDEYIASPYYRNNIPYDAGMTRDRAATLAAWDDAKKVRQFYAEKRPITSFFGNLAGQALDPINYIPVAGPLVKGTAVAKFGRVGGAALAGSLDAASNTAVFGLATADVRADLGDDVSWQAMTTDIAMAALIGGAFGAVGGVLGRRADARLEAATKEQLSTLRNVQEARVALNEAIDGLVTSGEINLSPNALEPLQRVSTDLQARFQQIDRIVQSQYPSERAPRKPQSLFDFIAANGGIADDAGELAALGLSRKFVPGRGALLRKSGKSLDYAREAVAEAGYFNHIYGDTERASSMSTPDDLLKLLDQEARGQPVYSVLQDADRISAVEAHEAGNAARDAYRRLVEEIDTARNELNLEHEIDDAILTRASEISAREDVDPVTALERAMEEDYRAFAKALEERGEGLSNEPEFDIPFFEDFRSGSEPSGDARAASTGSGSGDGRTSSPDRQQLQNVGSAQRQAQGLNPTQTVDATRPRPEPIPEERAQAENSVGRPDDYRALAEQYRVDPATGSFVEEADIAQLEFEGRLTEADKDAIAAAQSTFDDGAAYGEALKAAVACLT